MRVMWWEVTLTLSKADQTCSNQMQAYLNWLKCLFWFYSGFYIIKWWKLMHHISSVGLKPEPSKWHQLSLSEPWKGVLKCSVSLLSLLILFHGNAVVAFPNWTLGSPSKGSCALTNALHRVKGLLARLFLWSHMPSSEKLSPFLVGGRIHVKCVCGQKANDGRSTTSITHLNVPAFLTRSSLAASFDSQRSASCAYCSFSISMLPTSLWSPEKNSAFSAQDDRDTYKNGFLILSRQLWR